MNQDSPASGIDKHAMLLDENERLGTLLEVALEQNSWLIEDRERLRERVAALLSEVRLPDGRPAAPTPAPGEQDRRAGIEAELHSAYQQLRNLTEELDVANGALQEVNTHLEARVTERARKLTDLSADLHQSEAAFRAIANLVPDLLWQTDMAGRATWFNDRWYRYTGSDPHDEVGGYFLHLLHPDDREAVSSAWKDAVDNGKVYEKEGRIRGGDGNYRWFLIRAEPMCDEQGGLLRWFGSATDIHDQRMTLEALLQVERRLSILIEGVWQLVWRAVDRGSWTWSSSQWSKYTGMSETDSLGHGWLQALHPDDRHKAEAAWAEAEAKGSFELELRIYHAGEGRYRHFRTRAAPVRDGGGRIVEWLGTSTDVDDIIQLQQQQSVLVAELQHRTRNLIGVVESIVRRTIASSASLEDFRGRITDRLATIARVQGLLSRRMSGALVPFDALLREELSAHVTFDEDGNGRQVSISGPANVCLFPTAVQTLALALHELATNAVKYGALATDDGHLDVSWSPSTLDGQPSVRVVWTERGVANMSRPGEAPKGGGFGRELIERALPYQLGARTSYGFEEDGVRCTIEIPIAPEDRRGDAV